MKKLFIPLLLLLCSVMAVQAQVSSDDLQGTWTLTTLTGGDTTLVTTPEDEVVLGTKYLNAFPPSTTSLQFTGSDYYFTYYENGSRFWQGTFELTDPVLVLTEQQSVCGDCNPKVWYFFIESVSATNLQLVLFDEDYGTSTYARFIFTK
jgi:hypothetical protein